MPARDSVIEGRDVFELREAVAVHPILDNGDRALRLPWSLLEALPLARAGHQQQIDRAQRLDLRARELARRVASRNSVDQTWRHSGMPLHQLGFDVVPVHDQLGAWCVPL